MKKFNNWTGTSFTVLCFIPISCSPGFLYCEYKVYRGMNVEYSLQEPFLSYL